MTESAITILNAGKALVSIAYDGTITFGEGYVPDEAARMFWDALKNNMPVMPVLVPRDAWEIANRFCGDVRGPLSDAEQLIVCRALMNATRVAGKVA